MINQNKISKIIKFLVSGGMSAIVNIGTLYVLTELVGLWYLLSSVVGFSMSFFINFNLQKYWTFAERSNDKKLSQMGLFLAGSGINLVLNTALMYTFVDIFGIWYVISQCITSGLLAMFNYVTYQWIIFKKSPEHDAGTVI